MQPIRHSISRTIALLAEAKQANRRADASKLEAEIDQWIYQLYVLTQEEIAIVEGKAK